jgi:transposase
LVGRFSEHHAFMARLFLDRIDAHTADIGRLDERIAEAMAPFRAARQLLMSIPGFSSKTAEVFIAETGGDMSVFPSAGHLASWAGVSPGSNDSAGRIKSTKTRPGNPYLKGALGFRRCRRHVRRTRSTPPRTSGSDPGVGHCAHLSPSNTLIITAWNILTNGAFYRELGTDY